MHRLTIASLAALHALCHRIELTADETALLNAEDTTLSPEVWQGTLSLLADADAAGEGASLHLGYDGLILAWLRCRDEAECRARYDLTVPEALAADQGRLAQAARVVDGNRDITVPAAREAMPLLFAAWCERAVRLIVGDDVVSIGSVDRALKACPSSEETTRAVWTAFIGACEVTGKRALGGFARESLQSSQDENEHGIDLVERVIVEMVRAGSGPVPVLALMADIIGRCPDRDGSSLRHAHAADDLVWVQRDEQPVPAEWLGAAASRRCQSAWAPDAMLWLVRLAEASDIEPVALARWVVDRVDALARMLVPVLGSAAPDSRQVLSVLFQAAFSLGYVPDQTADAIGLSAAGLAALDEPGGPPSIPVLSFRCPGTGWQSHPAALEVAFGAALVVRLRASEVAQRLLQSGEDAADGVAAVCRAVLQAEQLQWIRWAAEQLDVRVLQSDENPCEARTRSRLVRLMALATLDDDALLRSLPLVTSQEAVQ